MYKQCRYLTLDNPIVFGSLTNLRKIHEKINAINVVTLCF